MKAGIVAAVITLGCMVANPLVSQKRATPGGLVAEGLAGLGGADPLRPFSSLVHLACTTLAPYVSQNDHAILSRLRKGDLRALEALYRQYEDVIFSLGFRLCGARADAEDILQETFIEVSRSAPSYRGEGSVLGWMKKICVSKALMKLRRTNRFVEETLEEDAASLPSVLAVVRLDAPLPDLDMEQAFLRLGSTARIVVWLHDVEGYTHEEISQLLGKTVSFSKSQLSRAHERLRDWLTEPNKDSACSI